MKKFLILLILPCLFLLTGCSGQSQLHERLVVKGIGVDLVNEEYFVTVQGLDFQHPKSKDKPDLKVIKISGKSVMEALSKIKKQTGLSPLYSQNLVVVIGNELAKSGCSKFVDFFIRHVDSRPRVKICVAEKKAEDILDCKTQDDDQTADKLISAEDISALVFDEIKSDVLHFIGYLKSETSSPFAVGLKTEDSKVVLNGFSIFKGESLVDTLLNDEALGVNFLKGISKNGSFIIKTEKIDSVTCNIENCSSEIRCEVQNNVPCFNINVSMSVVIFELDHDFYTHENEEVKKAIEEKACEKILQTCGKTLNKLIELNTDILNFGKILRNSNFKYYKSNKSKLQDLMKISNFKINSKVQVIVTGKGPV